MTYLFLYCIYSFVIFMILQCVTTEKAHRYQYWKKCIPNKRKRILAICLMGSVIHIGMFFMTPYIEKISDNFINYFKR